MSARDNRYCRRCKRATGHRCIRVSATGDENEGTFSRAFFGAVSFGMSELMSDYVYECDECGRRE